MNRLLETLTLPTSDDEPQVQSTVEETSDEMFRCFNEPINKDAVQKLLGSQFNPKGTDYQMSSSPRGIFITYQLNGEEVSIPMAEEPRDRSDPDVLREELLYHTDGTRKRTLSVETVMLISLIPMGLVLLFLTVLLTWCSH